MTRIVHRTIAQQYPVAARGEGIRIWDTAGKEYIDASGGAAVSCLGHSHPDVLAAMHAQLDKLAYAHTSFFTTQVAEELGADLVEHAPQGTSHVYFVSGGSEAVEAALKMARSASRSGATSSAANKAITATRWARSPSAAICGVASSSRPC